MPRMTDPEEREQTGVAEPVRGSGPRLRRSGGTSRSRLINGVGIVVVLGFGIVLLNRPAPLPVGDTAQASAGEGTSTPEPASAEVPSAEPISTGAPSPSELPPTIEPLASPTPAPTRVPTPKPKPAPTDSQLTPAPTRAITVFTAHLTIENVCFDTAKGEEQAVVHAVWEGPIGIVGIDTYVDGTWWDTSTNSIPATTGNAGEPGWVTIGVSHTATMKFHIADGSLETRSSAPFTLAAGTPCP